MIVVVMCVDEKIMVRNDGKIEGRLHLGDGRICPVFAVPLFQIFDAQMTVKLMYICCIWCVESFYQKSFELVEQNLKFRNVKKPGKCVLAA